MRVDFALYLLAAAFVPTIIVPLLGMARVTKTKVVWALKLCLITVAFLVTIFVSVISNTALIEGSVHDALLRSMNLLILLRLFFDLITAFMALIRKDEENGPD